METSILNSTKKVLGLATSYKAFDEDIIMHINATFATLSQLGIGSANGFMIEDESSEWEEFVVPQNQANIVRTYMFLKVRLLFDPPTTSFLLEAASKQIEEYEWRMNAFREDDIPMVGG